MDTDLMLFAVIMNTIFIAGGVLVILMAMYQRTKKLEMQHRERLAMIERGLSPAPETDPARFEAATRGGRGLPRYTSLGVAIVGVGFGLMLLIGFAGEAPGAAVGVGGAIVVLGAAFIVNGYLQQSASPPRDAAPASSSSRTGALPPAPGGSADAGDAP